MVDISTNVMGLKLKNPIIIGSSDLTNSSESIRRLAEKGAAAVVLKSVFEEQIIMSVSKSLSSYSPFHSHTETNDYLKYFEKQHILDNYLDLIRSAKESVEIPVIASVNCMSLADWTNFSRDIEGAGADAIELNIMFLETDPLSEKDLSRETIEIIRAVSSKISIPLALKISYYSENLANKISKYSQLSIAALTLFNKTLNPDIDIKDEKIVVGYPFSNKAELSNTLRWTAIAAGFAECDIISSTGIHNGEALVKSILAGANAVQMVSSIHVNSMEIIQNSLDFLTQWMNKKNYHNLQDFRGKLKKSNNNRTSFYERIQYMEYLKTKS